ncbi:pilus assembly protein N-terminal domain-containing protein [Rhodopseudomonas sp. HC1]|uniref:pilus assembly protein N-terminal domain-containing protein n=1 Tax=Rhodopseudomonas infernalis TaxID=2897386 RepID=UPI001EE8C739|nr:pilus assembly protein N-terminal domain-containing protein [Rhodopseudomonas infernalis]MCG6203830.1 pilus assembly protein N-terminal domain-containing protein [Rhodopseudomonas infernalis]
MSISFSHGARTALMASLLAGGVMSASVVSAGTEETISVNVDQAKLIRLPQNISTLVVGNPLIADVTLQPGGMVVVTGKGYGATNVIAMDRKGAVVADRQIQVEGPMDKVVTVYRGVERESYSCMPICQRRVTLGDSEGFFKSTMDQAGTLSGQASGAAAGPKSN